MGTSPTNGARCLWLEERGSYMDLSNRSSAVLRAALPDGDENEQIKRLREMRKTVQTATRALSELDT